MKHLLYEHQNNISELKAEGAVALKLSQDNHNSSEMDLRKDKRALKVELKEQELAHEDVIKNLKKVNVYDTVSSIFKSLMFQKDLEFRNAIINMNNFSNKKCIIF